MPQSNQYGSPPEFIKKGIGITPKGIEQLNRWFQFLMDGLPIPGDETIEMQAQPGIGRLMFANIEQTVGGGGSSPYPFQVTLSQDDSGNWFANVNEESSLLVSLQPNNNQTITGLGIDIPILSTGDLVYLDVQWTPNITGSISSCAITSFGNGGSFVPTEAAWASGDSYVFDDGGTPPIQEGLSVPIAQITFDDAGTPTLIPMTINNLVLQLQLINLIPAYIAIPFYARYQT